MSINCATRASILVLLQWISAAALAQQAPVSDSRSGQLEEIVVTAQKREQNLQVVPIAITALSGADLKSSGISNTQDLETVVPGLSVPVTLGFVQPHIRGVGTSANGPGIENPVAVYVDGVYVASAAASLFSFNNISQIETLKGPQGTLFGRNATGGLINVITADPSHTFSGKGSIGYGNYDATTTTGYLTGGLSESTAVDVAFLANFQGNGYGTNFATGEDTNRVNQDLAFRSKLLITPTDGTEIRLSGNYENEHGSTPAPRAWDGNRPVFGPPTSGTPWDTNTNVNFSDGLEAAGGSLRLDQKLGGVKLVSISAYSEDHFHTLFDYDFTPTPASEIYLAQKDWQFSQEFQLVSDSASRINWVLGAYYFNARAEAYPNTITFGGPLVSPTSPLSLIDVNASQYTKSYAGYAQATAPVGYDTNLTLGLRYTSDQRRVTGTETGEIFDGIPIGPLIPAVNESKTFDKLTWRIALDHQFLDTLMGYISYNRGFKSGGFNVLALGTPAYNPEQLDAYEIGFKSDLLDRHVRLNVASYYYDYKNIQVPYYTATGGLGIVNGPTATIYGLDLDAQVVVSQYLKFIGGLSLIHDRFGNYPNAVFNIPQAAGGSIQTTGDATDNRLPYTPDWTANVGADYTIPLPRGSIKINATYLHNDGFYSEVDNFRRQEAFNFLNSSVTWTSPSERYSLAFWGKNLLNDAVVSQLGGTAAGTIATYQPPRTYGVTVGAKF